MKPFTIFGILPLLIFLFSANEKTPDQNSVYNESDIQWQALEEAQYLAKEDNKPLFIFVEAEWCGTCKAMLREVFPQENVREEVQNFHLVSIDVDSRKEVTFNGESLTEREFAQAMQVQGTPTMIFVDSGGEVMGRQPGFMDAEELIKLLRYVRSDQFGEVPFSEFDPG